MNQDKEVISKAPSGRVRRSPLSRKNVLTVSGKDPDFQYRIVNDTEDRVSEFEEQGYEVVMDNKVQVGDKRVSKASTEGTVKRISVGGGAKAVVMRIPKEWYNEDQAAKQAHVDATESATKKEGLDGNYGKIEISRT